MPSVVQNTDAVEELGFRFKNSKATLTEYDEDDVVILMQERPRDGNKKEAILRLLKKKRPITRCREQAIGEAPTCAKCQKF
jgi:hypothetical protein